MKRWKTVITATSLTLVVLGACSATAGSSPNGAPSLVPSASAAPEASASSAPAPPASSPSPSAAPSEASEPAPSDPTPSGSPYHVTYDWAVPGRRVTVVHDVHAPIAPPPALPLPALVAITVSDHPEADPPFQRISFAFSGAFPEYNLQYVRALTAEGSGKAIRLDGNGVLRVGFVHAQAHDDAGASTIKVAPKNPIGFQNLKSYGFAGDFEGHVTYGLGIQVAPDSDQVLRIRAGEQTQPDGAGRMLYVVHIDIEHG